MYILSPVREKPEPDSSYGHKDRFYSGLLQSEERDLTTEQGSILNAAPSQQRGRVGVSGGDIRAKRGLAALTCRRQAGGIRHRLGLVGDEELDEIAMAIVF